jgi:hypothetical protein
MTEGELTTDNYFSGIAGSRFNVRVAGSIVMPTDSSAVTPRIGSPPFGTQDDSTCGDHP